MTGCRTCGGTFTGPVGTAAEALKFSANVGRELPTCPALETRATDIAPDTDGENESMIKGDVEPIIFRISSRPHAPAVPSAPSTQFRKGRRPAKNPFNPMEFSKSRARFRAWTLGTGREAGSSQLDALQQMTGSVKASRLWYGGDEVELSGVFSSVSHEVGNAGPGGGNQPHMGFLFDPSRVVRTAAETRPMNVSQPIITYLGRPR